ncbi:MAG: acyl-CoA dehydrogenase family protein [Desulfobacterales bacterium]|jgi:butyryl-CoA dehydrogenase|nr:acyl-CoA dehydrogenase family protein [Desulfobacterales bacterium]
MYLNELSKEQNMILRSVKKIASEKIKESAAEADECAQFPNDIWNLLKEADIFSMFFPEEYGGTNLDFHTCCLVIEELSKVDINSAMMPLTQELAALPIIVGNNENLKKKYIPKLASGEWHAAFAATEPEAGSDLGSVSTCAVLKGDKFHLDGIKHYISYADNADILTVFAKTNPEAGAEGLSCFVVEKNAPGLTIGKKEKKISVRGAAACEVLFRDCQIPKENLISGEGQTVKNLMNLLNLTRPLIAACAVGLAQGAFDYALKYSTGRIQFGKPICKFQGIQFMLADMAMEIEAARHLTYYAASQVEKKSSGIPKFSAMAKCFASDVAMKVTTNAVQILGGAGLMCDHPVERMMRDAKQLQIVEGTNQVMRSVIAGKLLR